MAGEKTGRQTCVSDIMSIDNWSVAVLRCKADRTRNSLLDLYDFVRDIEGVRDLHFLIRDRIDDEIVLSIRMLLESTCPSCQEQGRFQARNNVVRRQVCY